MREGVRYQGEITEWNDDKGFGFISTRGADPQLIFVAAKLFRTRSRRPRLGDLVTFQVQEQDQPPLKKLRTKLTAVDVAFVDEPPSAVKVGSSEKLILTWSAVYTLALLGMITVTTWGVLCLGAVVLFSLLSIMMFGLDKIYAEGSGKRVSEANLLWLSLLGGWPGAALAQTLFRHKTKKASFRASFFVTVALNTAGNALFLYFWARATA